MTEKETGDKTCPGAEPARKVPDAATLFVVALVLFTMGYLAISVFRSAGLPDLSGLRTLSTVFISILMQAFPFMLIGVLVSSAMHVFVPDELIVKIFPTRHGLGFLTAMFAGLLFPVCECAIVPVMTRLIKKGVAAPIAVTFMLSAPIINPIVILSTLYAFSGRPGIMLMRVGFGLLIALLVGLCLPLVAGKERPLLDGPDGQTGEACCCTEHTGHTGHIGHGRAEEAPGHIHTCACCGEKEIPHGLFPRLGAMFLHAGEEFFSVGKYLIIGAFATSLIQTLIPREALAGLGAHSGLSLFLMMAAAFLFSACSTSDAFIARSFLNRFPLSAVMGFLVFGPMMDVKNLLMLFAGFKKGFVLKLALLIFLLNFAVLSAFSFLLK